MSDIVIRKFRVEIPRSGATPSTPGFVVSEGQDPVNPPGSPTGIYVPYLGATGVVNLGEFGLLAGNLVFDTTPTNIPTDQGTMYWDDARQTVALIMNGTTQHLGQDQFVYVKNSSGSPIAKGVAVRNSGTDGGSGHILIEPMLANGANASETFLGVTAEEIPSGGFGQVMAFGELGGVNTNSYTAGAFLYVSTTVAGQFQTTAPVAPNNIILVGRAINSKNNGDILVRTHIGSNIRNDEGVRIVSPTNGQALIYNSTSQLWENNTIELFNGTQSVSVDGTQINDLAKNENFILFTGTNATNITGITGGVERAIIRIRCEVVNGVSFLSQNTGSIAGNRFDFNMNFRSGDEVLLVYRNSRWRVVNNGIFMRRDIPETRESAINFVGDASGTNLIRIFNGATQNGRWLASGGIEATTGTYSSVITHARSNTNTASARRDELYLNYSQTVATTGTLNDLAINSDCKLLILTGATDLTGVVPVDNTRLLRIEARGGNRIIRDQNTGSIAANRFALGADLTINDGEVYQFIYTNARWRRVL